MSSTDTAVRRPYSGASPVSPYDDVLLLGLSTLDPEDLFAQLARLVRRRIDHDRFRISLSSEHGEQLYTRFCVVDDQVFSPQGTGVLVGESALGRAILLGHPIVYDDVNKQGLHTHEDLPLGNGDLQSMMVLPLTSRGRPIGTLDLGRREAGAFSGDELGHAMEMAGPIGVVVAHAWMLEESTELTRMEERSRLARQVHDAVVQSLLRIVLHLELAERRLQSDLRAAQSEIRQAHRSSQQCLDDARQLVLASRPDSEPSFVNEAVLRESRSLESTGISVGFVSEGHPRRLPRKVEFALHCIAREAVANVRTHAKANEVNVHLAYEPDAVKMTISDDGVGFDPSPIFDQNGGGSSGGIAGARERARLAGGDLSIESAPGQGTTLAVEIPNDEVETAAPRPGGANQSHSSPPVMILIADSQSLFRQGLRQIMEHAPGIEVVADAANADEALEKANLLRPDVVLVDTHLPGMNGIELVARLSAQNSNTRSLILSANRGSDLVRKALVAGARAYLPKDVTGSALVDAIRAVHRGEMLLHPAASTDFVMTLGDADQGAGTETLSQRETEVLHLIAAGRRDKEIARELKLTEATIKYHITHLYEKLRAESRTEAIMRAQKLGVLTPEFST